MVAIRLPLTDEIIFLPKHIGDFQIDYSTISDIDDVFKTEDIKVIGDWSDFSGSAIVNAALYQGIEDIDPRTLRGQIQDTELNLTDDGHKISITRERPRIVHINL